MVYISLKKRFLVIIAELVAMSVAVVSCGSGTTVNNNSDNRYPDWNGYQCPSCPEKSDVDISSEETILSMTDENSPFLCPQLEEFRRGPSSLVGSENAAGKFLEALLSIEREYVSPNKRRERIICLSGIAGLIWKEAQGKCGKYLGSGEGVGKRTPELYKEAKSLLLLLENCRLYKCTALYWTGIGDPPTEVMIYYYLGMLEYVNTNWSLCEENFNKVVQSEQMSCFEERVQDISMSLAAECKEKAKLQAH
jgi:hypothetical protein